MHNPCTDIEHLSPFELELALLLPADHLEPLITAAGISVSCIWPNAFESGGERRFDADPSTGSLHPDLWIGLR